MADMKSIIFDLDDTLYPEEQYVLSGFKAVAVWAEAELSIPCALGYQQMENLFFLGPIWKRKLENQSPTLP